MKQLKYIYTLLIALLFGVISFACSDDEEMEQDKKGDDTTDVRGGGFVTTTITVTTAAPDLSVDLDGTRAGNDNANIDHDQTENGGRFQNIVVVVTNDKDSVYAIHCNKWYGDRPTSTGVKQYEVIFPDVQIYTTNGAKAKVYAFGNVDMDRWNTINGYTVEATRKVISQYAEINNLINAKLSVDEADLYSLSFVPESGNYIVDNNDKVTTKCTGMPVNGTADAEVKKGATKFSVHMRRVCARLQVTFRNFTGTYKDYQTNKDLPNKVYVDEFVIKNVLAKETDYFHDSVRKGKDYNPSEPGSEDFDILKALGGSKTNDHEINKIENGEDLVVSMYVFENRGTYTYNLKVDRGKSLGTDTRTFQNGNVYVIWNMGKQRSIAYKNGKVTVSSEQSSKEKVPFQDQVFWQLELGSASGNSNTEGNNTYTLKHYPIDLETDMYDISKDNNRVVYFSKQSAGDAFNSSPVIGPGNNNSKKQYVWFETANQAQYQINLCYSINDGRLGSFRYYCLTVNNSSNLENTAKTVSWSHWYDWTIYAKYIIKSGKFGEGKDDAVTQYKKITRNSSYSIDFSVMPNYNTKQELLVNCVRDQKTISWESVDK